MKFEILDKEQIYEIHNAALEILSTVGIIIEDRNLLNILKDHGAYVNEEKRLVKLNPALIEDCLKKVPSCFILGGRTRDYTLFFGKGKTYVRSQSGCDHIVDFETGEYREPTSNDVIQAAILQDALENIDWCGSHIFPSDVPPRIRDVYQLMLLLENTIKPIGVQAYSVESFRFQIKMAKIVAGDGKEFTHRPIISVFPASTSPLIISEYNCGLVMEAAKNKIPIMPVPCPMSGVSAPVTLAGSIAVGHAEILAFIVSAELCNPGTPLLYATRMNTIDMRTTQVLWGAIEFGLMSAACVQMARHIKVPVDFQCLSTESKIPDAQTTLEKAMLTTIAIMSKPDSLIGVGQLESAKTSSLIQMVIDNEICGLAKRIAEGIEVNEKTIALDLIKEVGPGGQFLGKKHTIEYFSKEHFLPILLDRNARSIWKSAGAKDLTSRAKDYLKKKLQDYEPRKLEKDVQKELRKVMEEAKEKLLR